MLMPFGRYSGVDVSELPTDYLQWLESIDLWPRLRRAVEEELSRRAQEFRPPLPATIPTVNVSVPTIDISLVRELVDSGYKALAKRYHPDLGGDPATMQRLNALTERLRAGLEGAR